jgi:hypothetical protein
VTAVVGSLHVGYTPPDEASILPIEGMDFIAELVSFFGNSSKDKNVIFPDDGSCMPSAWNSNFPADVVVFAPSDWRITTGCFASHQWTPPLRPIDESL